MDEQKIVKMITSILVTEKKCMAPHELMRQFRDQVGENIPYAKLGYSNLLELLQTIPGMSVTGGFNNETLLAYDASHSSSGHIQQLVMRQKNQQKKGGRITTFRPPMQIRPPQRLNPSRSPHVYRSPLFVPSPEQNFKQHQLKASKEAKKVVSVPMVAVENLQQRPVLSANPLNQLAPAFQNLNTNSGAGKIVRFQKENIYDQPEPRGNQPVFGSTEAFYSPAAVKVTEAQQLQARPMPLLPPHIEIEKVLHVDVAMTDENLNVITPKKEDVPKIIRERTVRTNTPMLKNYQLLGDDFLLYFAYRNLQGKLLKDSENVWTGMCYSGMTIRQALLLVEQNRKSQWHKMIVMLGHMDILDTGFDFEKSKHYMKRILETLSESCTSVIVLTLPLVNNDPVITSHIEAWNRWLLSLKEDKSVHVGRPHMLYVPIDQAPDCVNIIDLKYAFSCNLALCGTYKSQQHRPVKKDFLVGMWTHSTRNFVLKHLMKVI